MIVRKVYTSVKGNDLILVLFCCYLSVNFLPYSADFLIPPTPSPYIYRGRDGSGSKEAYFSSMILLTALNLSAIIRIKYTPLATELPF